MTTLFVLVGTYIGILKINKHTMKPLQILLLSTFFVFASLTTASAKKFASAEIHMKSGEIINCVVQMPIYVGRTKQITYKSDWEAKKQQKVKAEETEFLVINNTQGSYTLKWTKYYRNGKHKVSRHPAWLEVRSVCPEIITYAIAARYEKSDYGSFGRKCKEFHIQRETLLSPT